MKYVNWLKAEINRRKIQIERKYEEFDYDNARWLEGYLDALMETEERIGKLLPPLMACYCDEHTCNDCVLFAKMCDGKLEV